MNGGIKTGKESNILKTQVIRENKINTQVEHEGLKTQVKHEGLKTQAKNYGIKTAR